MRYLISGGCGFVGSHIVDALIERGDEVVVMDDLFTGGEEYLNPDALFHRKSIEFSDNCQTCCMGVDKVIHLAALASAPRSIDFPLETYAVNIHGTHNLLHAAREAGVKRFVFASSASYYGYCSCGGDAISEDQPPAPVSPCAGSKGYVSCGVRVVNRIVAVFQYVRTKTVRGYGLCSGSSEVCVTGVAG